MVGKIYAPAPSVSSAVIRLYTELIKKELRDTMVMTGCKTLSDITIDKIRVV